MRRKSMGINVQHLKVLRKVTVGKGIEAGQVWRINYSGEPEISIPTWVHFTAQSVSQPPVLQQSLAQVRMKRTNHSRTEILKACVL